MKEEMRKVVKLAVQKELESIEYSLRYAYSGLDEPTENHDNWRKIIADLLVKQELLMQAVTELNG